jgi:signal transduction histidine kinase
MRGTNEIASGNLNYRIDLDTHDEFGYLAGHFNNMANNLDIQQDKLRQSQSELEFRVAKRTFELLELNQDLKRMDAERLELLADISHELRTPITVIRGEAEVTLRGHDKDAGEYKDALQRITELAIQLAKYVNDLLFLARNDTASLQFEWEILELSELIHQVSEDFQLMAQEHALSLSCNLPEQPIWVEGDKQRLRQVLFILGENACRYSKTNAQIVFSSWLEGNQVNISLADQGIGIPETDLDKIFERHFRSENARQTRKDGSGLGLPLAKSIIKAHKGNLQVQSTENVGSKFTISLPLLSANEDTINE